MYFLNNFKIFKFISYKQRNSLKKLLIILLFTATLELLSIGIILPLIFYFLDKQNLLITLQNHFFFSFLNINNMLEILVFLLIIIFLFKNILIYFSLQYQARLLRKIKINFSNYLYKKYLLADYSVYLKSNSSIILRNLNEANNFSLIVYSYITFISEIVLLIFFILFLFWNDWKIACITLFLIFFLAIPMYYFYKNNFNKWIKEKQVADFNYNQTIIESVASIKEIKIYNAVDYFAKAFKKIISHQSFLLYKIDIAIQTPKLIVEVFFLFFILSIIYFCLLYNYSLAQTVSSLTLIVLITIRAMPMTTRLIASLQKIKLGKQNLNLLVNTIQDLDLNQSQDLRFIKENIYDFKKIEFNNVSYKYENSKAIINKLSFKILEKNIFGIFGKSGSGKSTILNLITGLLIPQSGSININETNLMNSLKSWRSLIGYVPQNVYLLNDSILNNIILGSEKEEIDYKKIQKSIDFSELGTFIDSLPLKTNTIVGENGLLISGGQKQRLGIARAIYKSSKILILDEPTSFLDESVEDNIIKTINILKKDITIILISHNINFKKICDSFIDLDYNN